MGKEILYEAFYDQDISRNLKVGIADGYACEVRISFRDKDDKVLGEFSDETYVKNRAVDYPFNIKKIGDSLKIKEEDVSHLITSVDIDHDDEHVVKGEEPKLKIIQALNIFILVAGTTDPVNTDDTQASRAQSYNAKLEVKSDAKTLKEFLDLPAYKKEAKNYWDETFYSQIKALTKKHKNFELFSFHGWTGDNSVENREIAGAYLVNRLCGAKGEKAFYETSFQNRPIHFHLIGHSHGGNVMNEMTKQMDKLGEKWPKRWKVKSMTYLSTPFFNKIHQVKVTPKTFHEKAEVLSLYNDYDLTQRVVADFSMYIASGANAVFEKRNKQTGRNLQEQIQFVGKSYKAIPLNKITDLFLSEEEGIYFYEKAIAFFKSIEKLIDDYLMHILDALNQETEYKLSDYFKEQFPEGSFSYKRQILDDTAHAELKRMFAEMHRGVETLKGAFEKRKLDVPQHLAIYSRPGIFSDLSAGAAFFESLHEFLDIDTSTLISQQRNSLWNVLYKVLTRDIEKYDNTYTKPDRQFQSVKVTNVNISQRDAYDKKTRQAEGAGTFTRALISSQTYGLQTQQTEDILEPKVFSERYYKFVKNLEDTEDTLSVALSQPNLMKLLFSLLAHSPLHSMIDKWAGTFFFFSELLLQKNADKSLKRLEISVNKLKNIFDNHYAGDLEVFNMGTLNYFMVESHSVSRRVLYKDVAEFLTRMGGEKA
jgi:hypothetical protein